MKFKRLIFLLSCITWWSSSAMAQVTELPRIALATHPQTTISRVELKGEYTIVDITYVNLYEQGMACAYPKYYIKAHGTEDKKYLVKAENIPLCPNQHYFQKPGETIHFRLYFPHIGHSIYKIDIVEGTEPTTFNFYGVSINNVTPKKKKSNATASGNQSTKGSKTGAAGNGTVAGTTVVKTKPDLVFNNRKLVPQDSISLDIVFEHASEEVEPQSLPELDKLLAFMNKYPTVTIQLEGHTERDEANFDAVQRASNKKLSEERVGNVRYYLVKKGISPSRVLAKGYGGTRPISRDQARNRRVVMKILSY